MRPTTYSPRKDHVVAERVGIAEHASRRCVGKRIDDADVYLEAQNLRHRTASTDGHAHVGTRDVRTDRVNLRVVNGFVTEAFVG